MDRKTFLKYTLKGGLYVLTVTPLYADILDSIEPYRFSISSDDFQNGLIETKTDLVNRNRNARSKHIEPLVLPKTLKKMAIRVTPSKTFWLLGEGRNNIKDKSLESFRSKNISKKNNAFTPVVLLKGGRFKNETKPDVYGQFVDSTLGGKMGIIRGFRNYYYTVYPTFNKIFTEKYICYGLPDSSFETIQCKFCNEAYVRQTFRTECQEHKLYAWGRNCKNKDSTTGNHDNLKLTRPTPCIPDDGIDIGDDY